MKLLLDGFVKSDNPGRWGFGLNKEEIKDDG